MKAKKTKTKTVKNAAKVKPLKPVPEPIYPEYDVCPVCACDLEKGAIACDDCGWMEGDEAEEEED